MMNNKYSLIVTILILVVITLCAYIAKEKYFEEQDKKQLQAFWGVDSDGRPI